jgi:hypothetical protein
MANTIGSYGVSDASAVRVVYVGNSRGGVSAEFPFVLAPDYKEIALDGGLIVIKGRPVPVVGGLGLTGLAPTVS